MLPTDRAATLNDRSNDYVGFFLHGLGDTGDCAEAERTYRAFQDELCADERHCQQCGGEIWPTETLCRDCAYPEIGEWPQEDTDAIVGPLRIDTEAMEAWAESRARDFDVTDEVPF